MGALDGPSAASNFDAAVAGRRGVCACRLTSNPLLSPYEYDGFVWDLACGSGSVSESLVDYAGSAGLKVGRVKLNTQLASQGFTDAIYQVGWCYVHGAGTETNLAEGKRWLERAATKGRT